MTNSTEKMVWSWLDSIVINLNLCPFAKKPRVNNQIKLTTCEARKDKAVVTQFWKALQTLQDTPSEITDTTLFIIENHAYDFFDYLDLLDKCQSMLEQNNLAGEFQLASFHPNYVFDGVDEDDKSNYTNRAPFPIIHILREESLTRAVEKYPNPEQIPENNITMLNRLNDEKFNSNFNYLTHS